jgi:anti-sigma B factor antagonist
MTETLVPAVTTGSVTDGDASVVAITLSWPASRSALNVGEDDRPGGEHIVELIGEVDIFLVARVRPMLCAVAALSAELVVDASGVQFIDASGLGLIVAMHREITATGGRMQLIGATPALRRLLRITCLEHLLYLPVAG